MKRKKLPSAKYVPITWQPEAYDADESDLEDIPGIPRPLTSLDPNYPLEELELDLEETLITLKDQRTEGLLMPEDVRKIQRIVKLFLRDMNIVSCDVSTRYLPPNATCENREPESEPEPEIELIVPSSDSEDSYQSFSESDSDSDDLQVEKGTNRGPMSRNSSGYFSQETTSKSELPSSNRPRDLPGEAFQTSDSQTSNPESLRKQNWSYKIRKKAIKYLQEEPTAKELCSPFVSILEILKHSRNNPRSGRTPGTQTPSFKQHKKKNKHCQTILV